jgi:hypothetical protein
MCALQVSNKPSDQGFDKMALIDYIALVKDARAGVNFRNAPLKFWVDDLLYPPAEQLLPVLGD